MEFKSIFSFLDKFPFTAKLFMPYIDWISKQPEADLNNNDLIELLSENDTEKLKYLESHLIQSREILGITEENFKNNFGFSKDLLSLDPEKVHDILAEPLLVVDLSKNNFSDIKKLPKSIKHEGGKISVADFSAHRFNNKYAIELKTIRMENKPKPISGKTIGNAMQSSWWRTMFKNNLKTKIEDKNRRVIKQLENTKIHFSCDLKMLAIYTRRLSSSTLMITEDYKKELTDIKNEYEDIDYIFFKDYFGEVILIPS